MRLIKALLGKYLIAEVMNNEYPFSASGIYYSAENLELPMI